MAIDENYFYGAHGIDIEKAKQAVPDLVIVKVKEGINVKADTMEHLQNEIIKKKETGVIVLPWFLTAITVPEDIEIKVESEDQNGYE